MLSKQDIIQENKKRLAVITAAYDPQVGTYHSPDIPRNKLELDDAPLPVQYIPAEMEEEPLIQLMRQRKTLSRTGSAVFGGVATDEKSLRVWKYFLTLRCRYDFEFWCCTQIKIKLKGLGKRDYFVLNRPQRMDYLPVLERLRKEGAPIDVVLLKARQWGGSTMTEFYTTWIQTMHKKSWNSIICGDIEKQSKVVLSMLENAARDYDTFITDGEPMVLKPYARDNSIREIVGRNCTISICSMQKPDKVRSEDISMAHLTEVGLWKTTQGKQPEDVIESIVGSILPAPYTLIVLESTAKGVGNYFHQTWLAATRGENNFTPVFVPWFHIDMYSKPIRTSYESFIDTLDEYEHYLFKLGATLEAIHWYRAKKKSFSDDYRLKSEFPSTPEEAFQSTGQPYFKRQYLEEAQANCKQPKIIGEIVSSFNNDNKEEYLHNLRIDINPRGNLKVWEDVDKTKSMRDRYLVTCDLGKGGTENADSTIVCVFDRYWQQQGEDGYPEVVAEYAVKESETDLLAWRIAQIAAYYNNALLVIESNTIDSSKEDRFRAILDEIKDFYPNIYKRPIVNKNDTLGNTGAFRYGWNTNHASKEEICADLAWALREGMYVERNSEAIEEMQIFERHTDGSLGNVVGKGNHDDRVITRALGIHFCYKKMQAPAEIEPNAKAFSAKKIVNDMSI